MLEWKIQLDECFAYIDLQLRYIPIRIRMELMKRKLKRQLVKDQKYFLERSKEHAIR